MPWLANLSRFGGVKLYQLRLTVEDSRALGFLRQMHIERLLDSLPARLQIFAKVEHGHNLA